VPGCDYRRTEPAPTFASESPRCFSLGRKVQIMLASVIEKLYTVEEFKALELLEDDELEDYEIDEELELIEGVIVRRGTTSGKHADIVMTVGTAINNFAGKSAGEKRTGTVYPGASTNLGNPQGKNFPKPDLCFVLKETYSADFEGEIPVAPDLVVEVNSPSDTDERRFEKLQAYRQNGVKLIWSIHMLEKFVLVYKLDEDEPTLVTLTKELDGGKVLPGFKLPVKTLFD
jgi:Uma2 family endonuclease